MTAARKRVDPARLAAFEVLKGVRVDDGYANLLLPAALARHGLTGRDAAFATELASGTIRRQGTYDAVLAACIDRPLRKVEAKVLDALRLGAHQVLGMRVPTHAAIDTTVTLVRAKVNQGAAGFCNAVLRKVAAQDLDAWLAQVAPGDLAVAHSHPAWVVEELRTALREASGELPELLAADNLPPRVTLVARPGRASRDELPGTPTPYSPHGVVLEGGDPSAVPAVAERRAGVQDEGSQLVALAAADAPVEGRDEAWVDLCAGPGGKASLLAALAAQRGARLVAVERHHHRAGLVRRAVGGDPGVLVVQSDGTRAPFADDSVDRILLDAPCTGLGALRRRPEARWRRTPEDLAELVDLQRALLEEAVRVLRPGGALLYATCSPLLAETAEVVARASGRGGVVLDDLAPVLPAVSGADGPLPGTLQLWPHRHGTDAMFLALLRKQ
ncbi:16S rRNA (cytosine967-C5)-methyltransferase [Nocardioides sp. J9]|uniref:RsmB/NOP family class I SAM-dependent RNA methyltransferase n=1 Tax=Nocardioides sp. J9 TaxID=935844 RepID=UPI0011AB24A5|nr:transcription antitermination factor NusB [Nocardioides sp. J9]TWG92081.1 16S rRNA (cytosine967-C5)-methyltransferase [Nocardioides sp. J9]